MQIAQVMDQAAQLVAAGQAVLARNLYRQVLNADPMYHPAYHALGLLSYRYGDLVAATELLSTATKLDRSIGTYQCSLCKVLRSIGQLDKAITAGRRAVKLIPQDAEAHFALALALAQKRSIGEAVVHYTHALTLQPQHDLAWNNLAVILEQIDELPSAEYAYNMACNANAHNTEARNNMGALYARQGRLDEARDWFNAVLGVRPNYIPAHFNLSSLKTYQADDSHLIALENIHATEVALPSLERIQLNFALGKAREDIGDYDNAFSAYEQGNCLHYQHYPYAETRARVLHSRIKRVLNSDFFARYPRPMDGRTDDNTPIFIVGMPRSGTTLIEQMLSSHHQVYGAGEISDLSVVIESMQQHGKANSYTEWCNSATAQDFSVLGKIYQERVWNKAHGKQYVTDKMPGNFLYLGMIHLMLPNAKIIHAMRDPMDTCFSCYSRLFHDRMEFTYDFEVLGRYYLRYIKMMEHWHKVLPAGTILDVRYEDVVADAEGQTRRMLDYIGLPWDKACLDFHKNQRHVATASMAQVCKPLYSTSVERWKKFEAHLQPLMEILMRDRTSD
jgi:tetratricopeptide (TPR) repeat protein